MKELSLIAGLEIVQVLTSCESSESVDSYSVLPLLPLANIASENHNPKRARTPNGRRILSISNSCNYGSASKTTSSFC
jgi:hypothetical protein